MSRVLWLLVKIRLSINGNETKICILNTDKKAHYIKMKKYIIFLMLLVFGLSYAEAPESKRRANPDYKYLKLYAKVLKQYGKSNYYQMQLDLINTGPRSVSFWLDVKSYIWTLRFEAVSIRFVDSRERECYLKGIKYKLYDHEIYKTIRVYPHAKYTFKADFRIYDRKNFIDISSNKNLKLIFLYNDANLYWNEDPTRPKIESSIITYDW